MAGCGCGIKALRPIRNLGIRRMLGRLGCGARRTACISIRPGRRYHRRNWHIIEPQWSGRICQMSQECRLHSLARPFLYPNLSSLPPVLSAKKAPYIIYYAFRRNQVRTKRPQIDEEDFILSLTAAQLGPRSPISCSVQGPFAESACRRRRVGGGRTRAC